MLSDAVVRSLPLTEDVRVLHCSTAERLRLELECVPEGASAARCSLISAAHPRNVPRFSLKRGTSDNCYLVRGPGAVALVDVPESPFADSFSAALGDAAGRRGLQFVVLTHFSPRRADALAALLAARPASARTLEVWCSNPAAQTLRALLAEGPGRSAALAQAWRGPGGLRARLRTVRGGDRLELGGGQELHFALAPTPRWPDALTVHHPHSATLFTGKLFSAHVTGAAGAADSPFDEGGFDAFGEDWRFFYECLLAPVARQAAAALERLDIRVLPAAAAPRLQDNQSSWSRLLAAVARPLRSLRSPAPPPPSAAPPAPPPGVSVSTLAPLHGPVVRAAAAELLLRYGEWTAQQVRAAEVASVAVIYASAYGNTGALASALARGITKAGAAAVSLNAEFATQEEVSELVSKSDAFLVGSPTLGGHMPTPVKTALGTILQLPGGRDKPCGVFGSFGWSGEAVDEIAGKLRDGGFKSAFDPIRVKFTPTEAVLQACEEAGTDVAQAVLRSAKARAAAKARGAAAGREALVGGVAVAALGRVVGSLCVLTAKSGDASSAMVASWVSQASFSPPAITVAVAKDRAVEGLILTGSTFVLNILAAGSEKTAMKALLKPFAPGADRFSELETTPGPRSGAAVLPGCASAFLECRVEDRLDAGDHWVLLATVEEGQLLKEATTAVHYRKSGANY